jgi:hypothetical protein
MKQILLPGMMIRLPGCGIGVRDVVLVELLEHGPVEALGQLLAVDAEGLEAGQGLAVVVLDRLDQGTLAAMPSTNSITSTRSVV